MKKRIISMLLAIFMVAGMLPTAVFAADVVASGTCGTNVNWTLDSDGTMTISGEGAMDDYITASDAPWYAHKDSIKAVKIAEGVNKTGTYAFYKYTNVTQVIIYGNLTEVGSNAFANCSGITTVQYWGTKAPSGKSNAFSGTTLRYVLVTSNYDGKNFCGKSIKKTLVPDVEPEKYTVSISVTEGGTVTGAGEYEANTAASVTATPNEGYKFINWTEGDRTITSETTYVFTVTQNRNLVANFAPICTLKWMVGNVEYKSEELEEGAAITVPEAPTKAAVGCTTYAFDKWDAEIPETMPANDLTFTAVFTETTEHKLTYTDNGDGTHSASCVCGQEKVENEAHTYGDNHFCVDCEAEEPAYLYSYSLSLKGNIAINYYMHLAEEILADETAFMRFTLADGQVIEIPVSQAIPQTRSSDTYYVFSCAVDAKEMTDVVKAQFFYGDCATQEYGYTVQSYAEYMLDTETDEKLLALVKALLHYGSAAQTHFGYNTGNLADAELEAPDYSAVTIPSYDVAAGQGTENVKFHSAALILKSETTLRFFFTAPFTAEYDGNTLEVKERNGLNYVDVIGISAKDLDENVTIAISDGENTAEVTYNPMAYCAAVQADATGAFDQKMKNLVTALYLYNQAANMYLEEN